ncbi:hypothetical protein PMW07_04170, partial [Collinsella aerofaciens]|uniref:hypothetical protein n=1 Tax=Collinsella aerofaciens TaxID=74426 RepID=UPI00232CEFD2
IGACSQATKFIIRTIGRRARTFLRIFLSQSLGTPPITTGNGNADVLVTTAKTRQSEQGALKQGGIDLLIMPPKLKGRLPLWRVCSVEPLRRSVERRNP